MAIVTRNIDVTGNKAVRSINNKLTLLAFDSDGNELPEQKQIIWNSPMGEYQPKVNACVIITSEGERTLPQGEMEVRLAVEAFEKAINIKGIDYYRHFAWGSGVKDGKCIGLTDDLFKREGILSFSEDRYRLGRAYFPNSSCGLRGKMRVGVRPIGENNINDGFGYIRKSYADVMQPQFQKIAMGKWQSSFSFLQRFSLTQEMFDELLPHYEQNLAELANQSFDFKSDALTLNLGQKAEYITLDERMKEHPYIANALTDALSERMFRVATTGGFMMDGAVFAPTSSNKLVLPSRRFAESNEYLITRYPVDGFGSIRCVETEQDSDEADRIANMEIIQYTLTNGFQNSFKGLLGIIADDQWPEEWANYDIVVSTEDEKLNSNWVEEADVDKTVKDYTFDDAVLSVTQWWLAGSAMGIPGWLAKALNGDYDGDAGGVLPGNEHPEMVRQCKGFPKESNPKLPKTKTPVGDNGAAYRALLSMANLVGHATNVVSTVLGVVDQELVAEQLGYKNAGDMHEDFMYSIKMGTDIFKTSADYRPVAKKLSALGTRLNKLGIKAPWTKWRRDEVAFKHELPLVGTPAKDWTDWQKRNFVLPEDKSANRQDAIIPALLRWILPQMTMHDSSPIRPLIEYREWAIAPANDEQWDLGRKLLTRYAMRIKTANLSDPKAWAQFENEWQMALKSVSETTGISMWNLINIIFYISHNDQRMSQIAKMASAAFVGSPEHAKLIVQRKPGLSVNPKAPDADGKVVVVTGLRHQLPGDDVVYTDIPVKVVEFTDTRTGKPVFRKAIVSTEMMEGQQQPTMSHYPRNMIGMLAVSDSATVGEYKADFLLMPGKSHGGTWQARLS